jgi:hypothetical protein
LSTVANPAGSSGPNDSPVTHEWREASGVSCLRETVGLWVLVRFKQIAFLLLGYFEISMNWGQDVTWKFLLWTWSPGRNIFATPCICQGNWQHTSRFYCSLTSAYIILPPNISKPFSQYTNLIVVYVPHLMVLYWCDHGVGCLLLETERSPLQPRGYGTNFLAGWKKLPVSRPSRWALYPISLAVTYQTDSSAMILFP